MGSQHLKADLESFLILSIFWSTETLAENRLHNLAGLLDGLVPFLWKVLFRWEKSRKKSFSRAYLCYWMNNSPSSWNKKKEIWIKGFAFTENKFAGIIVTGYKFSFCSRNDFLTAFLSYSLVAFFKKCWSVTLMKLWRIITGVSNESITWKWKSSI